MKIVVLNISFWKATQVMTLQGFMKQEYDIDSWLQFQPHQGLQALTTAVKSCKIQMLRAFEPGQLPKSSLLDQTSQMKLALSGQLSLVNR